MPSAQKGAETREAILEQSLRLASRDGLDGLTIGTLAKATRMSKSGLFAHFGSREELQLAVLEHAREVFIRTIVPRALTQPRGLARLRALFRNWLHWTAAADLPGGCVLMSGAAEFDDRPGPIREALARMQNEWRETLLRAVRLAVDVGELRPDTDLEQFVFECYGIGLVAHHHYRLLDQAQANSRALTALGALIQRYVRESTTAA